MGKRKQGDERIEWLDGLKEWTIHAAGVSTVDRESQCMQKFCLNE